jgi:hypothetical protein
MIYDRRFRGRDVYTKGYRLRSRSVSWIQNSASCAIVENLSFSVTHEMNE